MEAWFDDRQEDSKNGGHRISREVETLMQTNEHPVSLTIEISERRVEDRLTEKMDGEEKSQDEKKSKIPMLRLRQAVEKVKRERQAQKARGEQPRRSSIPRLTKDAKKVTVKRDTSLNFTPQVDDEFDKLYEEIVDNKQKGVEEKLPSVTMEDPEKIETKFEEIIHAYDEDEHEKLTISRVSKIPALRRKDDDGSSRLGALIDRAKEKSTITESKLKDGGFKVTASTIRTKRFSRGNSRDLSSEQQIEVTETIDIRESGDNDVFVKETVIKTAPAKPERTFRNITKRVVAENKTGTVETKEHVEDTQIVVTENLDKKDGTMNKTKRFNRTVSKETRERNLNRELSKNLEDIRREFKNRIEESRIDPEFNDFDNHVITTKNIVKETAEATPVKTERIIRDISKEINEDGQNINSTETVTVEELDNGGTRTITTKTTESLKIGTPVVTEKTIRNISRGISTEGQNNSVKGVTTIEEITDEGGRKITTYVRENATGIPIKTERFTRGISREMGNIKQRSSSKETVTPESDNKQALKKETMTTEQIEKEGVKGIPVYTKVTRSFSKGKIQNVEMSRTVEWKPADEVKSKNYSRSVSEKVTKKELKDAGKWKYEAPVAISEVTDVNDQPNVQTDDKHDITYTQNSTPKDPVLESKIKNTVNDIASKITTKKVTEYKSEEQVTNVEKTTYTLSSNIDLAVDRDFKSSREIGTQMSIDGKPVDRNFKFVKEFGTQMSVEGKSFDSPFDRDFKLAKERNLASKAVNSTIDEDPKASKEFGTQVSVIEKTVVSSIDGESKASREFGTQMSVVGKIVDRDFKVSKEIGTQMSLERTKQENDSDKVSKENAILMGTVTEKSEIGNSNLKNGEIAEVTVLKGNVSRLKDKIAKETVVVSKKEPEVELPKKKSVLSKIAIFERLEPKEPVVEVPTRRIKCKYVPPNLNRTNSADRPKIVDEVLKYQTQSDPLVDTSKVEKYDEVVYRSEPAVVTEYWTTEGPHVTNIKQVTANTEATSFHSQEKKEFETAQILPATIDFKPEESKVEFTKIMVDKAQIQREPSVIEMPTIFPAKVNYEADIGKTKPGKINLNIWSTQVEINKSTVDKIDVFKEESLNEIAQTLPGKVDIRTYESHVPVSSDLPGFIDLNKEESVSEGVSILPARISHESSENSHTLVDRIDSKIDNSQSAVNDNLPGITQGYLVDDNITLPAQINYKSYEIQTEVATTLPAKIENQTEIAKTLTAFGYTSVTKDNKKPEANQKGLSTKPKPGKINLGLWQSQVETNKTFVGKTDIRKNKETEMTKALSGRANVFNRERTRVRVTETVQGTSVLNRREYKAEIARTSTAPIVSPSGGPSGDAHTLPGKIEFDFTENHAEVAKPLLGFIDYSSNETQEATIRTLPETVNFSVASSQAEVATTLPAKIDFSSSENQVEEPNILIGKIDFDTEFVNNESKAEISETVQDNIYLSSTENQTFLSQTSVENVGKLDLKAWEHQVEVNKTLVDKIDVVKGEHLEEIAKTLPGKIDFVTYETHVGEPKTFQAPIDSNIEDNKVEITEIEGDAETDGKKVEVGKILPGAIEIDPIKHTPRFNPLPMLIRLNSLENKVLRNETAQGGNVLKDNVYKVDIPLESNPVSPGFSDPELEEDPAVEVKTNTDSVIGSIKRKLFFITNKSKVQDSTNTPMNTPVPVETYGDNDYEKRVDELQTKSYSISDISHKTHEAKTVSSFTSIATDNTYEITAQTIEESYTYSTDNYQENSATECKPYVVQNKVLKSDQPENNFITSPSDYKENLDVFESNVNRNVSNENGFNFDIPRAGNALTRSAYGADDFKRSTEELKRAKSLAELDLGDVVQGQVKRIVGRIKSVDFSRRESVKTEINIKELPRKMSVLEKIALYEGKTARSRYESTTIRTSTTKKSSTPEISEEAYVMKIEELKNGKTHFGRIGNMTSTNMPLADGCEIPIMALGTALMDPRLLTHIIGAAIDMGFRAIDTAYIYGNEKEIGQAIKAKIDDGTVKRQDLYIISKLWSTFHRTDLVEEACKASLDKMGLDYFDLYLIHNPMSFKEGGDPVPKIASVVQYSQHDYLNAWVGMEGLVSKGLARRIGVSNFNSQQVQMILDNGTVAPVINQVECHPYLTQQRLHDFCAERNVTLSCFGVLGSKGTPDEYKNSTTPVIDDALIKVMASGLNVTTAQLLIRYQIDRGHNVVVKASSAAHLWDNLQALNFKLKQSQIDALNALNKNKRTFAFTGMGDTHRNYPFVDSY